MIDKLSILPKLEKLHEYVGYLKGYKKHSADDLRKDYTFQGAVLRYLQLSIECTLDIGEMLISGLRLRKPEEVREVITILAENEIIPDDFAQKFIPIANLRNRLVHEYAKIDLNKIYDHLQNNLEDFDFFARKIAEYLSKA